MTKEAKEVKEVKEVGPRWRVGHGRLSMGMGDMGMHVSRPIMQTLAKGACGVDHTGPHEGAHAHSSFSTLKLEFFFVFFHSFFMIPLHQNLPLPCLSMQGWLLAQEKLVRAPFVDSVILALCAYPGNSLKRLLPTL